MKSARAIKTYQKFISGNIYNYEEDDYIINVYLINSTVVYFGVAHFFKHFIDVNIERKRKLKKLNENR